MKDKTEIPARETGRDPKEPAKLMLFTSCVADNFPATLYGVQQWSRELEQHKGVKAIVGVEMGSPRSHDHERGESRSPRGLVDMFRRFSSVPVVVYSPECDDVISSLLNSDDPKPFFLRFAYGSFPNRM